jgi:hypothetical protein
MDGSPPRAKRDIELPTDITPGEVEVTIVPTAINGL